MEKELWKYLKTANKPIVLYGMGNGADKILAVQPGAAGQLVFKVLLRNSRAANRTVDAYVGYLAHTIITIHSFRLRLKDNWYDSILPYISAFDNRFLQKE